MTATARKLAAQLKAPTGYSRRRQAIVVAIDTPSATVSIQLGGDTTTTLTGIAALASYAPRVGDTVWVDQVGPDLLVLGTQGLAGTVADPQDVDITTSETSASTSYVNLATVGPTISNLWLPAATPVLVIVSARCSNASGSGHEAVASYSVSGASTQAAADVDAVTTQSADAVNLSRASVFLTTGTGNHTFQMKYKVINASTGTFANRRLVVWPGH